MLAVRIDLKFDARSRGRGSQQTVEKRCSQAGQKGPRGEAGEKPTSGGVLEHYVGARRGKRRNRAGGRPKPNPDGPR